MKKFSYGIMGLVVASSLVISACVAPKGPVAAPAPEKPGVAAPAAPKAELTREQKLIEAAKANREKEVVVWVTSWNEGHVEKAFEARYPFLKVVVWAAGAEAEARLFEEYKAGVHSVDVYSKTIARIVGPAAAGLFEEYDWPNMVGWPDQPPTNLYRVIQDGVRIPVYNTRLVSPADVPKTWEDLNDPKWRGKAIIGTGAINFPLEYAHTIGDLTAEGIKWDRTVNFWKKVMETTRPVVGPGFLRPMELVIIGEVSIQLVGAGTPTTLERMRKGAPIDFAPLKRVPSDGNLLALPKNPPHPNAARLFVDWVTSEEGGLMWAKALPNPTYDPRLVNKVYANQFLASRGIEISRYNIKFWKPEYSAKATDLWLKEILRVQ